MREVRSVYPELMRLAAPVAAVQVGMMAMGVVDTVMVGRVSASALGAVALGNLYWFAAAVFGMGSLFALDPLVSQAVGARDDEGVAHAVQRGLALALPFSLLTVAILASAGPVLSFLRQPLDVVPIAVGYCWASMAGALPFLGFVVLRQTLQAMGVVWPIVVTVVAANVLNALLNWLFVFGHGGFPAMGAVGTGVASSVSRWVMLAMLAAVAWPVLGPHLRPRRPDVLRLDALVQMLRLGAPVGLHMLFEYGAFAITGLLMGALGTLAVAAHQIALNLAALTFMVPVGVAQATAVLVGRAVGRGQPSAARRSAQGGLVLGTAFMCVSAAVFLLAPELLARAYTDQADVVRLAVLLIPIAGVFQVADGLQVVAAGALRGVGDTRIPMIAGAVGFYAIGLPAGFWLSRGPVDLGPVGLWWGLAVGLGAVACFLLLRVWIRLRGHLDRLGI